MVSPVTMFTIPGWYAKSKLRPHTATPGLSSAQGPLRPVREAGFELRADLCHIQGRPMWSLEVPWLPFRCTLDSLALGCGHTKPTHFILTSCQVTGNSSRPGWLVSRRQQGTQTQSCLWARLFRIPVVSLGVPNQHVACSNAASLALIVPR